MNTCLRPLSLAALAAVVAVGAAFGPASAGPVPAAPRPAPPCTAPSMPGPIASEFSSLGGITRFGCAVSTTGPVYEFRNGKIEAVPSYGSNATYAVVYDADQIFHVYLSNATLESGFDQWLVRLDYDGSLVNQVAYKPGQGDIGGTYANDILVHPSGRKGTFQIGLEGCYKALFGENSCIGWSQATMQMQL